MLIVTGSAVYLLTVWSTRLIHLLLLVIVWRWSYWMSVDLLITLRFHPFLRIFINEAVVRSLLRKELRCTGQLLLLVLEDWPRTTRKEASATIMMALWWLLHQISLLLLLLSISLLCLLSHIVAACSPMMLLLLILSVPIILCYSVAILGGGVMGKLTLAEMMLWALLCWDLSEGGRLLSIDILGGGGLARLLSVSWLERMLMYRGLNRVQLRRSMRVLRLRPSMTILVMLLVRIAWCKKL